MDKVCGDEGEIWIFDRWGIEVFHGDVLEECWNGTLCNKGGELSSGVYYYLLELKHVNENGALEHIKSNGVIHLIR
ncbi:MAG: gliding motility-associated C-terminal domain-containing protein [Bacteroidia bacterium]